MVQRPKQKVATAFQVKKLEPIPEAEKEVKNLAGFYDPQLSLVLIHDQAQEQKMKEKAGEFEIIHLATHGIINNTSPMYSHLLLSSGSSQDGLLEAWEISEMNLKARLIVLSACVPARTHRPGRRCHWIILGFVYCGFSYCAVESLKVDSASTTELMIEFHENFMIRKLSPDIAVQQAALQLMKKPQYLHPFYCGGVCCGRQW